MTSSETLELLDQRTGSVPNSQRRPCCSRGDQDTASCLCGSDGFSLPSLWASFTACGSGSAASLCWAGDGTPAGLCGEEMLAVTPTLN